MNIFVIMNALLVAAFILGYLHRAVIDYDDINATCA